MSYEVIPISLIVIFLYLITYVLNKENVTTKAIHMKMWNIIILISILILVSISLIHTFIIEYSIDTPLALTTLFWHVEFGIALVPVGLIHVYLYRKSFRKITLRPLG
ncbi:MAG: hypothetical protein ACXVH2_09565 [Methanobacterium sp.]